MKCEQMEHWLIAYLDERANPAKRREVEAHLAVCGPCQTRAEEFRALWGVLDEVPMEAPTPAFDARLRARIAREPRPSAFGWLLPSPRLAFAASLLLLLSVWIYSLPPAIHSIPAVPPSSEAEFKMIKDLPVLEDYDVLANFDALSELPMATPADGDRVM
jgi:anti-sigma factor RsiW